MDSQGRAKIGWRHLLAMSLGLIWAAGAIAEAPTAPRVSVIQVPLELDLGPLIQAAESALPAQAGHWPGWHQWHGIDARYRAWRGPLHLAMQGDVLQIQAHVRYQVEARKELIGRLGLSAGCGIEKPPRQALIGVLARLEWAPDWSLRPRFQVLPTRFLDPCEVTLAEIDVSPLVGRVFADRIQESLAEAMRDLAPRLQGLRAEAARTWEGLQVPVELTPGLWLQVQPLGLALAPLHGAGNRVETAVWLAFRGALSSEPPSKTASTPLPPLFPYRPAQPGLRFSLGLELDYARLATALSARTQGQTLEVQGHQIGIDGISLAAQDQDLVLNARLTGDVPGRLTILGRPAFDPASQALKLEQVDFVFDADDLDQAVMAKIFYDRIRAGVESAANALLAERTRGLQAAVETRLVRALPPGLAPYLGGLRIAELSIQPGAAGLSVSGWAQGSLKVEAARSAGRF
jgi:hypothetical protein